MVDSALQRIERNKQQSRRGFLLGSAAVGTVALAGCMGVLDLFFDPDDVMLANNTDEEVRGSVTVTNRDESQILDERFELDQFDSDDDATGYEDVLQQSGTYSVSIELDDGYAVDGTAHLPRDVDIHDPEDEGILVVFGPDNVAEPIVVDTIEDVSEIDEYMDWE